MSMLLHLYIYASLAPGIVAADVQLQNNEGARSAAKPPTCRIAHQCKYHAISVFLKVNPWNYNVNYL